MIGHLLVSICFCFCFYYKRHIFLNVRTHSHTVYSVHLCAQCVLLDGQERSKLNEKNTTTTATTTTTTPANLSFLLFSLPFTLQCTVNFSNFFYFDFDFLFSLSLHCFPQLLHSISMVLWFAMIPFGLFVFYFE